MLEHPLALSSKIVDLPRNTNSINIVVSKVNDNVINKHVFSKVKKTKLFRFSFLYSLGIGTLLIAAMQIILEIFGKSFTKAFIERNYIAYVEYIGVFTALLFIITFVLLLTTNRGAKRKKGEEE